MSFIKRNRENSFSMPILNSFRGGKTDHIKTLNVKVTIIGDSAVGKSSLTYRIIKDDFSLDISSTIGAAFCTFDRIHEGVKCRFKIWDTAGQERFKSLVPMYLKDSQIIFLVFDTTNRETFSSIKNYWFSSIGDKAPEAVIMLVGSKNDLSDNREVSVREAIIYAEEIGAEYIDCSAKIGTNVSILVDLMVDSAINRLYVNNRSVERDDIVNLGVNKSKSGFTCFGERCMLL